MSDNSAAAIPWDVYDQLRIYLWYEDLPQLLPESELHGLCRSAIAAYKDRDSVSLESLVDSITRPYLADQNKYVRPEEGTIPGLSGPPAHYDLAKVRAIVQDLCDARRPTDGEMGVD